MREAEMGMMGDPMREQKTYEISQLPKERYQEFIDLVVECPEPGEVIADKEKLKIELLADLEERDQIFVAEDGGKIVAGLIGTPRGRTMHITTGAVDPSYRGKRIIHELNDAIASKGKEFSCQYIRKEINCFNIPSIVGNLNNGFIVYGRIGDMYVLVRDIDHHDQEELFTSDEMIEVSFDDKDRITSYIKDGYAGVDIKNLYEEDGEQKMVDKTDLNPAHWTMIMRKINPEALPFGRN